MPNPTLPRPFYLVAVFGLLVFFVLGSAKLRAQSSPPAEAPGTESLLTIDRVFDAVTVLEKVVRKTDLIYSPGLSGRSEIYLKPENLQLTGTFKLRGAYYKISRLSEDERRHGVVSCSTGNHAQGVALSAARFGLPAVIYVPAGVPHTKLEAIRAYGAEVVTVDGVFDDAQAQAIAAAQKTGAAYIPPFDDLDIIAGQGSIGWEILRQMPEVEAVVVPVGGGGLISGIAFTIKILKPSCKVYGVQAAGAASMVESLRAKKLLSLPSVSTLADGIAVKKPGRLTYQLCQVFVDDMVTVTDQQIKAAIRTLLERDKILAEGAGAVPVAAIMHDLLPVQGKKVVLVISGGNIDAERLADYLIRTPE